MIAVAATTLLAGCVSSANFVSSAGFEVYVSPKRYEALDCATLQRMAAEFRSQPAFATLVHSGLGIYPHRLSQSVLVDLAQKNGRGILHGLERCN